MRLLWRLNNFLVAVATLIGTIIGVGMFGLPYVASRAGLAPTLLYLFLLGAIVTLMHLVYGEIILRTQARHRLVGYAEIYLGQKGKFLATLVFFIGLYGAMLAYLLVGGEFLMILFSGLIDFSSFTWSLILAAFSFYVIFRGLRLTGFFEVFMTLILLTLILGLLVYGGGIIEGSNLVLWNSAKYLFLPYGVILFALGGGAAIPEIRNFFGETAQGFKKAIITGTLIPALVYLAFIVAVLGISGLNTSAEAISGLLPFLGGAFVKYGALVGFLAVTTSIFTIGLNLKNSFHLDFGLSHALSFVLTLGVPIFLFVAGLKNFIAILSLVGAILGGLEGILLLTILARAKLKGDRQPEYSLALKNSWRYGLILIFLAGIIYQFVYLF